MQKCAFWPHLLNQFQFSDFFKKNRLPKVGGMGLPKDRRDSLKKAILAQWNACVGLYIQF